MNATGIDQVQTLVKSCRLLERMNRGKGAGSETAYFDMLAGYFQRILTAEAEQRPLALHTVFCPVEILDAMGITPIHAETSTWMTAAFTNHGPDLLEKAQEMSLATEICSAHRGLVGAYALGLMPRPDVIISSSLMCDNTAKCGDLLAEINGCPDFFIDHPFSDTPREREYLLDEFRELIDFLEKETGHRMDWDRLSKIIARSDYQIQLAREIAELRKSVPSPFPPQRFLEILTPYYLLPGQPEAIRYMEILREELKATVREQQAETANDRFRLMTIYVPPIYGLSFLGEVCAENGAVSVVEPLFSLWPEASLDPSCPLESLVQKSFMFPEMTSYGPFQQETLDMTVRAAEEYNVDGAIFYAHIGCRQAAGTLKPYRDALVDAGIPVLSLQFDILDDTVTPEEELRKQLEQFFELLEDR